MFKTIFSGHNTIRGHKLLGGALPPIELRGYGPAVDYAQCYQQSLCC